MECTFKWIKDYEFWFQLAGLLSFQDWKEASQVFQIDCVISTGCLVSMPNYTENVSLTASCITPWRCLLLIVQFTWSSCSRNAAHYPEVDWQIVLGFFSPEYDTEIMNDGYKRCEKCQNEGDDDDDDDYENTTSEFLQKGHWDKGKRILNGLKTTCWHRSRLISLMSALCYISVFIVFLMADTRHKTVIQLFFNTS